MKKTAVITDATSPDFFFPRWRRYYGGLFGFENLHVITYKGMKPLFQDTGIGNIWEINSIYNDPLRAKIVSQMVGVLLNTYDVVLRCDVDEFLFPDPAHYLNLVDFVERNDRPYVTAHGIDIIELEDEPALDPERPVIGVQRHAAARMTALNKTCLTTIPLHWAAGFHGVSVHPWFSGLYLFHLKYADYKARVAWNEKMLSGLRPDTPEHTYFGVNAEDFRNQQRAFWRKARVTSESGEEFDQRYLNTVTFNPIHTIYQGLFFSQDFLFELGSKFNTPAANF